MLGPAGFESRTTTCKAGNRPLCHSSGYLKMSHDKRWDISIFIRCAFSRLIKVAVRPKHLAFHVPYVKFVSSLSGVNKLGKSLRFFLLLFPLYLFFATFLPNEVCNSVLSYISGKTLMQTFRGYWKNVSWQYNLLTPRTIIYN
jgi:hypothetical protein